MCITIGLKNQENILGEARNNKMFLSAFGHLIKYYWHRIPQDKKNLTLNAGVGFIKTNQTLAEVII